MYSLEFERKAAKDFKKISKADIKFLKDSILEFVKRFSFEYEQELMRIGKIKKLMRIGKIKKLKALEEELYRLKLRSYRVIYKKENDKLIILVVSVKSRKNSYKK